MTSLEKLEAPGMKFTFWKNNKSDQEFKLTTKEIALKFENWLKTKEKDWLEYYSYHPSLMQLFIGSKEDEKGLQSVSDYNADPLLWEYLKPIKNEYLKSIGIK